jgi:hypothetical protein
MRFWSSSNPNWRVPFISKETWRPVEFSNRIKTRIWGRGARGDPAKCLAELIKNSDDTYYRIEKQGLRARGNIEIGYWHLVMKKRSVLTGFYVRDWGQGMTRDTIAKAYESYGEDTTLGGRNAAIGVGGKDALYGMEQCYIVSVKDHAVSYTSIRTTKEGILECTGAREAGQQILDMINKQAHLLLSDPLSCEKNGTIVLFKIPKNAPHPHLERLRNRLENYYTLRNILEDSSRKVTLVNTKKGTSAWISHKPKEGKQIHTSSFALSQGGRSFSIDVVICKCEKTLSKERDIGDNLLVQDSEGAILDNTMFGFENYRAANQLFGKVIINDWRELYKIDETILTDNREGLDFSNPFNKQLRDRISKILKPLIEASSTEYKKTPELEESLKKRIRNVFSYINKLIEREAEGGYESEQEHEGFKPESMQFSQSSLKLLLGQERHIYLYFNPDRIPPSSIVLLGLRGEGIEVSPTAIVNTPSKYEQDKTPFVRLAAKGTKENGHAILKASYNEFEAEVEISVVSETEFLPKNGFSFSPENVTIPKEKTRKLRLIIDTRTVRRGRVATISALDNKITVQYSKFVVLPPNLGDNLREELIPVSAGSEEGRSQIVARSIAEDGEIEASCSVKIVEKEPPKQFLSDFKLDKERDGHQRASYENGIVYVHVNSPILIKYFGQNQEKLNKDKEIDAIAILADTVLQCVTKEWAKFLLDRGVEVPLGANPEIEVERIRNKLEYKYGAEIHGRITAKME